MRTLKDKRVLPGFLMAFTALLVAAGCSPKVDRQAPAGSAPPSGDKGAVQPGTVNKAPTTD